jgi:hypothetical protein
MADDPWAAFRAAPAASTADPWAAFRGAPAATQPYVQPEPPPGEIIHGKDRSYISDHPEINTTRPADDPTGRDTAVTMDALKTRGNNADSLVDNILRKEAPLGHGYTFGLADELVSSIVGGANKLMGGDFSDSFDSAQDSRPSRSGPRRRRGELCRPFGTVRR